MERKAEMTVFADAMFLSAELLHREHKMQSLFRDAKVPCPHLLPHARLDHLEVKSLDRLAARVRETTKPKRIVAKIVVDVSSSSRCTRDADRFDS